MPSPTTVVQTSPRRARGERVAHDVVVVAAPVAARRAASMFLVGLPPSFRLPLVLLLGGATGDDRARVVELQAHCALPVCVVEDGDLLLPGRVHLAPADYHLLFERDPDHHLALSVSAPVGGARPSIDVLFESAADTFGARAVCVLLGRDEDLSADGRAGADRVRARGGLVVVEDTTTAAVGARGDAPLEAATVLHLSQIAPFVTSLSPMELT